MGGQGCRGRAVKWLEAGVRAGQRGLPLDTFPSIPHALPGNGQGPLCSSCSQRLTVARPRETKLPECGGAGNNMGWAEEGHRKCGREAKELALGLGVTQGLVT